MDDGASPAGENPPSDESEPSRPDDSEGAPDDGEPPTDDEPADGEELSTDEGEQPRPDDGGEELADEALLREPLEPGSPSFENAAFVVLGMVTAVAVWLMLLP